MQVRTTNTPAEPDTTKVTPADALRHVLIQADATRTAALNLCYSSAFYLLVVNYFADVKSKDYLSKSAAVEFLTDKIKEQTGVKNRMLSQYVNVAVSITSVLMGSPRLFADTMAALRVAETAEEGTNLIAGWFEKHKGRKIDSMRQLNVELGYSEVKAKPTEIRPVEEAVNLISNLVKEIAEAPTAEPQQTAKAVAAAVAPQVEDKTALIIELIHTLTKDEQFQAVLKALHEQEQTIKRLATKAAESVKETPKVKPPRVPVVKPSSGTKVQSA